MNRREVLKMLSLSPVIPVVGTLDLGVANSTRTYTCAVCDEPYHTAECSLVETFDKDLTQINDVCRTYAILGSCWFHDYATQKCIKTHKVPRADILGGAASYNSSSTGEAIKTEYAAHEHPLIRAKSNSILFQLRDMKCTVKGQVGKPFDIAATHLWVNPCPICDNQELTGARNQVLLDIRFSQDRPYLGSPSILNPPQQKLVKPHSAFGVTTIHFDYGGNKVRVCYCDFRKLCDPIPLNATERLGKA